VLLIETALVLLSLLIAFIYPSLGSRWFEKLEDSFGKLARRQRLSVVVVGLTALIARAALLPVLPVPSPGVHDEFSYLLMSDTFAHGRLSNPTHPMWVHFESFHINQEPTYVSMFYPAQGLFLATGQTIFGHPFWGVWLSIGFMCAGICWMLQAWISPEWALLGGFLAAIRLGTFSYWANSYWGGAAAAIGGALVLGSLARIKQYQSLRNVLLMGLGLAILANSRPFEGLFFSTPVVVGLVVWVFKKRGQAFRQSAVHVLLPLGLVLTVTASAILYYCWRTTGSPFRTPYLVNVARYNPVPYFAWQSVKSAPDYRHPMMAEYYLGWWLRQYELARQHPLILVLIKAHVFWFFFLGPLLVLPVIMLGIVLPYGTSWKDFGKETRFLLIVFFSSLLGLLLPVILLPHYASPMTCLIYALVLLAMKRIRNWCWREKAVGVAMVRYMCGAAVTLLLLWTGALAIHIPISNFPTPETWCSPWEQLVDRAAIQGQLENSTGRQLVITRYSRQHNPMREWVYNLADIDNAKVVWAQDMGAAENAELIRYFQDRYVWLVEPDANPPKLSPYIREEGSILLDRGKR